MGVQHYLFIVETSNMDTIHWRVQLFFFTLLLLIVPDPLGGLIDDQTRYIPSSLGGAV